MKGWMKIMTRCVVFALAFSMLFSHATDVLRRPDDEVNEIHAFYDEPEQTMDVLYVGSSPFLRGISPMKMWAEYGFTGYVRASALQAPSVMYGILAESLEAQSPEVVVIGCDNIYLSYDYVEQEGDMRRGLDGMKMSKYKFDIIMEVAAADERQSMLSYVFPLFRYHDRWKEIDLAEDEPNPLMEHSFKKGHIYLRGGEAREYPGGFMMATAGSQAPAFDEDAVAYIEKTIALCKERDIPVLILHLPKMAWTYEQSMALEAFANEQGVAYLDCDQEEVRAQLGIDTATDYYDQGHMNLHGSLKLSTWLGEYLDSEYDLPDHRGEEAYSRWNEDLALYQEKTQVD